MTKTEFETFVRALTDQAISESPHYRQQLMTEFYGAVAEDFIDRMRADASRLEGFPWRMLSEHGVDFAQDLSAGKISQG